MDPDLGRQVVASLGGRYSVELGIDVDAGDAEVERWFLASTLFGARISTAIAARTFRVLDDAGVHGISLARTRSWEALVELLDRGGYARYDFRTATRLQTLADVVLDRYDGRVATFARFVRYPELRDALDALPGWGPVTIQLFLRELRGVWPGATPPVATRASTAARHLGLADRDGPVAIDVIEGLAASAGVDVRDLESGLVRLALAHRRPPMDACPGGRRCTVLAERTTPERETARATRSLAA